ncbi:TPA: hypothetical protein ACHOZL_005486, partial [Raoultella ornithinolytica]
MAYVPPVGQTTDPDIFLENVKRADRLVSGPAETVPDRGGEPLDTWRQMMAKNDEVRQNLIPLSKQYMNEAAAQADIANIPEGSTTYYRSPDDSALAIEAMNVGGTLQPTGRKMPSQQAVDLLNEKTDVINETVHQIVFDGTDNIYYYVVDSEGNIIGVVRRNATGHAVIEYKNHAIADQPLDGIFLTDQD